MPAPSFHRISGLLLLLLPLSLQAQWREVPKQEASISIPANALVLQDFVQAAPMAGAAPGRATRLHLWHDGKTLFVEAQADDPEPSRIVARQMRRDVSGMLDEDQITLVIDSEGKGRNGYLFALNAHGAQYDALIFDGGERRNDWDALWHSQAEITEQGWRARFAIPLTVLGRNETGHWRINAERWMPRGSERVRLAAAQPDKDVYTLADGIEITAVESEREDWGLRLKPSLRLSHESAAAGGDGKARHRIAPGLELFHEGRHGLRSTLALNIDFGEAEADEREVNLTRFELFFPEKREFFLRDAGRFSFGGLEGSAVMPYYSRRIGLGQDGRGQELDVGLKFTGSMAGLDFGAFGARTSGNPTAAGQPDNSSTNVAVLRVAKALGERQRIGLIATHGNPQGIGSSQLQGVDYQFRDTAWAGDKTLTVNLWGMRSKNPASAGEGLMHGSAWGGEIEYFNIGPTFWLEFQRMGEDFKPALGYLAEDGVMRSRGTVGWWHRNGRGASITPAVDWRWRRTLDGEESSLQLNPEVEYVNAAGDYLILEWFFEDDRLREGFAPLPGTWIAAGKYRWDYFFGLLETSHSRPVWLVGELRLGGYYDGKRNDQVIGIGWKPGARWEARASIGRNAIELPTGDYTVKLASLRFDHTPNTRLANSLLLQWDNVSESLGASARMRWQWASGREVIFSLDRLGYTGEHRSLPDQTRVLLKFIWNIER